jgi:hypothetical protein
MKMPRIEDVDVIVRSDGRVAFWHTRLGERREQIVSAGLAEAYFYPQRMGAPPSAPDFEDSSTRAGRAGSTAVDSGSSANSAAHRAQNFSREPCGRIPSRPQRSQYLVSKTVSQLSTWEVWIWGAVTGLCAAVFIAFLCRLLTRSYY